MRYEDKRRYEMLVRVHNFGAAHRPLFPDTSSASAAFAVIAAEVPHLEALDLKERLASQSARTARKAAARALLIEWLIRAKNTTRALVKTIPQLAAHVDLPDRADDRMLLTIARQFAAAIAPHVEPFAEKGIAVGGLGELIEPFEAALNDRGASRNDQTQARADIAASMARALEAIDTLDLTVPNHLAGNTVKLAAWYRDRRITRPARREKVEAPAKTETTAPVPVTDAAPAAPVTNATSDTAIKAA